MTCQFVQQTGHFHLMMKHASRVDRWQGKPGCPPFCKGAFINPQSPDVSDYQDKRVNGGFFFFLMEWENGKTTHD
jgi:hypothetical protein